jgi:hypothetical protein
MYRPSLGVFGCPEKARPTSMRRCRRRNCWPLLVGSWAEEGAHLYLWSTKADLPDAIEPMERWKFKYIATLTWIKSTFGLGSYFRASTEHVLFGVICSVRGPSGGITRRVLKTSGGFLTVSEIRASLVVPSAPKRPPQSHSPTTSSPASAFERRRRGRADTMLAQPSDRKRRVSRNGRFSEQ